MQIENDLIMHLREEESEMAIVEGDLDLGDRQYHVQCAPRYAEAVV